MCQALTLAHDVLARWLPQHRTASRPSSSTSPTARRPTATLHAAADALRSLIHQRRQCAALQRPPFGKGRAKPSSFPPKPGRAARRTRPLMFELSSPDATMRAIAQQEGYVVDEQSRGFVFNADMVSRDQVPGHRHAT
jgi:hypothetical protein